VSAAHKRESFCRVSDAARLRQPYRRRRLQSTFAFDVDLINDYWCDGEKVLSIESTDRCRPAIRDASPRAN